MIGLLITEWFGLEGALEVILFCLVVCGKVLFYELLCLWLMAFKFAQPLPRIGSMSEVFHLLHVRKNGLSEVVGDAEGDAPSWTCSWTHRNHLSACWGQEGLPSPSSFLQTQAQWCLVGSISSCISQLGHFCLAAGHNINLNRGGKNSTPVGSLRLWIFLFLNKFLVYNPLTTVQSSLWAQQRCLDHSLVFLGCSLKVIEEVIWVSRVSGKEKLEAAVLTFSADFSGLVCVCKIASVHL